MNNNIENIPNKIGNPNRIPIKERMAFQIVLMKSMLGEKSSYENEENWNNMAMRWIEKYGGLISNIIDDIKNKEIRDFIIKKEYKEASSLVAKILEKNKISIMA